jgi:excisionase family DNA binding protein
MLQTPDTKQNMQGIILTIDKDELENIIARAVETALLSAGFSHVDNETRDDEIVIMRAPDVCKYLNMKISTLYQLTHKRGIPCYKKGKILYFKKEEIDLWIADGKQQTIREQNFARELRIIASDKKRHKNFCLIKTAQR